MKIKRFIGDNLSSTIAEVKKNFGEEALILTTRNCPDNFSKPFSKKKYVEIIAAGETDRSAGKKTKGNLKLDDIKSLEKDRTIDTAFVASFEPEILQQLREIRNLFSEFRQYVPNQNFWNSEQNKWFGKMMQAEICPSVAASIVNNLDLSNSKKPGDSELSIEKLIKKKISDVWKCSYPFNDSRIVALVGPTGVGKTTTIAKLTAIEKLKHKKKTALITVDTYRISAVDQLKTYADILQTDIRVVSDRFELKNAIEKFNDADLILIDTSGRSQHNQKNMEELKNLFDFDSTESINIQLCLSAVTRPADMENIMLSFQSLPYDSIVLTKIDETVSFGHVLTKCMKYDKKVSFITNGQEVPDHILTASPEHLVNLIFNPRKVINQTQSLTE